MEKNCLHCKKTFQKLKTRSRRDFIERCKFCSKSCYTASMKGVPLSEERKSLLRGRVAHNRKQYLSKTCAECGGFFTVPQRLEKQKCCSVQCAGSYKNEGKSPLNKILRMSAAYKAWRTLVFERDDYTCKECGQRGGKIHADHIQPFAFFPTLRFEVSNGRTLCVPCHTKTETYGGRAIGYKKGANAV